MTKLVKTSRSLLAGMAMVAGLALTGAGSAQAGTDVFWSIAMSQTGIHVGVSNGPVLVHAPRVYVPPQVVYVPPRPVYHAYPSHYHGHGHGHWKHHDRHHGHHGRGHDHHGRGHDRHDRDHHAHRGSGGRDRPDLHMGNRR